MIAARDGESYESALDRIRRLEGLLVLGAHERRSLREEVRRARRRARLAALTAAALLVAFLLAVALGSR